MKSAKKGFIRETIETIVIAFLLAFLIRTFIIQVFYIPSGSMEPTLQVQDRIVVNKFIYRFREPRRGEIVVFKFPSHAPNQPSRDFIKRMVGLPGDVLKVEDGLVYINNELYREEHALYRDHAFFGPVKVPAHSFFVMGDNRGNSSDSRFWGFLPRKNLIGPAFLRIWPFTRLGPLSLYARFSVA